MKFPLIAACICLGLFNTAATAAEPEIDRPASQIPLATIASLDVPRYMGTWYEIARFPNWFQKKCAGNIRAEYSLQADGTVQVVNRCKLPSGETSEAIGAARQIGGTNSPKLQVRFAPAWLSFIPSVWGNYWVIDLDERYQIAAVSEPGREYLWILSRTPQVEARVYAELLERLGKKGFDLGRLVVTKQEN